MKRKFQASFNRFHVDSHSGVRHDYAGELKLQAKELAVLVELIVNAGKLVTKEDLIKSVWGGYPVSDSSIARCISAIKSQLKHIEPGSDALIKMVYGQGYKFVGELTASASFLCEESFTVLINTSPDFILFKDGDGRWLEANQSTLQSFDLTDKDWRGKTDLELTSLLPAFLQPTIEACIRTDADAWKVKIPSRTLEMIVMADSTKRYFDIVKSPLFNKDGTRNLLIIFGRDVTDLSRLMERQKLSEQVLENSREAVMITDIHNNIVSVNRAFTIVTEYTEAEVVGRNPSILASGRQDKDFYRAMWHQIRVEGVWRGEIWDKKKSGDIYQKWLDISSVHDQQGKLSNYIAIFSDLSERRAIDERIEFLAYHDPLTGLPNRLLLHDRYKQAVASAMRENTLIAVLFLDLDKFKQVNDQLGHATGDELLQTVAKRIELSMREVDTVSRIGGDEFAVLLTDLKDVSTAAHIAEKIINTMTAAFVVHNNEIESSLSIGIAIYPNDGLELDTLLRMADASMYHAKNRGRNNFRFFSEQSPSQE